ncbi:glycosyltransferase family 39 protein [Alicyclobacillus sp. SP_1]|uniref:glycosyltransferase family 39 protein n=1 Tax=Alicyclobacillus sp. SP_1 TaxID=2942475 RepID=UPI002157E6A9|nr:glycosyltransferase family 39 protein [Alicyclobacillus sp. SP_1]
MFYGIAGLLVVIAGSIHVARVFFPGVLDRVITALVFGIAQVMVAVFFAGAVLRDLSSVDVFACIVVLALAYTVPLWLWHRASVATDSHTVSVLPIRMREHLNLGEIGYAYVGLAAVSLIVIAMIGYFVPPYAADELGYHLVTVATWIHARQIIQSNVSVWSDAYPKNAELLFTWLYLFKNDDTLVHLGQWLFALCGMAATAGLARMLGVSRGGAVAAATLFFLAPTIFVQASTDYVDLAFASMFLTALYFAQAYMRNPTARYSLAAGVAGGIALGIKADGALYIGICALWMLVETLRRRRQNGLRSAALAGHISAFLVPLCVLGSYWYIQDWSLYGNPIYPFVVTVLGHPLFPGFGTVQQLVMRPNTPTSLLGLPPWKQIWLAWTGIPTYFSNDMAIDAFGPQWILLEFPALVLFTVYTLWRDRRTFFLFVVPLWIIFWLQTANWWGRYTMFMVAFGAIALAYMLERLRMRGLRSTGYLLALILVVATYVVGGTLSLQQGPLNGYGGTRTISQDFLLSLRLPPRERTTGRIFLPEYAWVDGLRHPTVIGFTTLVAYPYPLFGRHAQNTVLEIMVKNPHAFDQEIVRDHIQYLMTTDHSPQYRAAMENPQLFRVYNRQGKFTVFAVNSTTP